jgi:hypothetical protein
MSSFLKVFPMRFLKLPVTRRCGSTSRFLRRTLAIVAVLAGVPLATLSSGAHAATTLFLRTNSGGGVMSGFVPYATLADLGTNTASGSTIAFSPSIPGTSYLFFDGVSYYKTVANSGLGSGTNQIVRYGSVEDLAIDASGTTFNFEAGGSQTNWPLTDDFFADGLGNYYRNASPTNAVTQYPSFADLVADTNGSPSSYSQTWDAGNRFFAAGGTFYRTNSAGTSVQSFVTYDSYADLLSGTSSATTASTGYATTDNFIAYPVPEPAALALGLCGMVPYLCWASRRSWQQWATSPREEARS